MARKPRIHLPGGLYHIILRGNGQQPLFFSDEDRYRFYLLLQEGTCRFGYRVHAFCLMGNHVHLVLQAGETPLSPGMQNLSFRYTRWINSREKRSGHLFQGRYKAILVDSDSYLLELIRYIHLNPVRSGLVKDPEDYPWSGHRAYLGMETLPWLTTDWVLGQFWKNLTLARNAYRTFVLDGMGEGARPEFHQGGADTRILGDDWFAERCRAGNRRLPSRLTVQEIAARVCREYGIDETLLKAPSQRRIASEARAVVAWLARELGCATLSEVGTRVCRDVGSISSAVRRLTDRCLDDPQLAKRLQTLHAELAQTGNSTPPIPLRPTPPPAGG